MNSNHNQRKSTSGNKEIEKYLKFFVLKSLQCVAQSRVGCKERTRCNPKAMGLDWFNISLQNSEVNDSLQNKIREVVGKKVPALVQPICLDIILKTSDGKYTILESWQLSTDRDGKEEKAKNHFSVYSRLGVLLKSVISISRILPSYHLSRKLETDFDLYFKLHSELYSLHNYELHNSMKIGSVATPSGKIGVTVLYRNKIWLSGSFHAHTYVINDTAKLYPLSSYKSTRKLSFEPFTVVENEIEQAVSDIGNERETDAVPQELPVITFQDEKLKSTEKLENPVYKAAFADFNNFGLPDLDLPEISDSLPFISLIKDSVDNENTPENNEVPGKSKSSPQRSINEGVLSTELPIQPEAVGFEDDFVLVELRPAFFSDDDSIGNLYKQCKHPPALDIFASLELEDNDSEAINVDQQIEKYKIELQNYQDFFQSLI